MTDWVGRLVDNYLISLQSFVCLFFFSKVCSGRQNIYFVYINIYDKIYILYILPKSCRPLWQIFCRPLHTFEKRKRQTKKMWGKMGQKWRGRVLADMFSTTSFSPPFSRTFFPSVLHECFWLDPHECHKYFPLSQLLAGALRMKQCRSLCGCFWLVLHECHTYFPLSQLFPPNQPSAHSKRRCTSSEALFPRVGFLFLLSLSDFFFFPFFFQPGFGAIGAPHPSHTQNAIAHQQGRVFADYIRGQTGDLDGVGFFFVFCWEHYKWRWSHSAT